MQQQRRLDHHMNHLHGSSANNIRPVSSNPHVAGKSRAGYTGGMTQQQRQNYLGHQHAYMINGLSFETDSNRRVPPLNIIRNGSQQSSQNDTVLSKYQSNLGLKNSQLVGQMTSADDQTTHTNTLANMTNARQQKPVDQIPPMHLAKYRLSMKSSVTKANGGKIEQLGTFKERAQAIQSNKSHKNFFTQHANQTNTSSYYDTQKPNNHGTTGQKRGYSQLQLGGQSHMAIKNTNSAHMTGSGMNSGQSSYNIRSSKYNQTHQNGGSIKNLLQAQARKRSAANQYQMPPGSSLQKLQVTSEATKPTGISSGQTRQASVIDYSSAWASSFENNNHTQEGTKDILGKHASAYGQYKLAAKNQRQNNKKSQYNRNSSNNQVQVLCSSDTQDERVRLIVVQSSFADVIQAMYTNERSRDSQDVQAQEQSISEQQYGDQKIRHGSISVVQGHDSTLLNDTANAHQETSGRADDTPQHNLLEKRLQTQDSQKEAAQQSKELEETNPDNQARTGTAETDEKMDSILVDAVPREIKMMDTITFIDGFQPVQWIFTDLLGKIQSKEISQITVNEVIKAFLINLNQNKKTDFSNDDLMQFLDKDQIDQKICFAIKGQKRELLDIKDLLDLHKKFPKGIDALQLFKIPTRAFIPFYFQHILSFDQMGRPLRSTLLRLPIKEVQSQMDTATLKETLAVLKERQQGIQEQIQRVSNDVVSRLTEVRPVVLLNIVIVYLLEENSFEPWFIGTEKCEVLTQKITQKKNKGKRRHLHVKNQSDVDIFSQIQENYENLSTHQHQYTEESHAGRDSPTRVQIISAQMQNLTSGQNRPLREGRASSTTTVFQKLDSRSHITSQKNAQNDEGESSHYMMMLNGNDETVQALLLNNKDQFKAAPVSATGMDREKKEEDLDGFKKGGLTVMNSYKIKPATNRPQTQALTAVADPYGVHTTAQHTSSASQLRKPLSSSNALGELGTPIADYEKDREGNNSHNTSFMQLQNANIQDLRLQKQSTTDNQMQLLKDVEVQQDPSSNQSALQKQEQIEDQNIAEKSGDNSDKELCQPTLGQRTSGQRSSGQSSQQIEQKETEQADAQVETTNDENEDGFSQMLQNQTFLDNLVQGVLYQSESNQNQDSTYNEAVQQQAQTQDYQTVPKQRGKSANVFKSKHKVPSGYYSAFQSTTNKSPVNIHRQTSALGLQSDQLQKQQQKQPVYLLQSNELLTQNELFSGLAKIGTEYGKAKFQSNQSPLYNTNKVVAPSVKGRKSLKTVASGRQSSTAKKPRAATASRIQAFLDRQENLKVQSNEIRAQRMLPKAHDNRLLSLFPQFLNKAASKNHSKFLFGDAEQAKVFRNYKQAMFSVEQKAKNLGDCMLPQDVIKDEVKMFILARESEIGNKIFDMKMSDQDEIQFLQNYIDQTSLKKNEQHLDMYQNNQQPKQVVSNFHDQYMHPDGKNLDLASLDGSAFDKSNKTILDSRLGMFEKVAESSNDANHLPLNNQVERQGHNQPFKVKDFLTETLKESRLIFKQQSQKQSIVNLLDQEAKTMIDAQKELEGVVVTDVEKVLNDFKNHQLFKPMGDDQYSLTGQAPKVNSDLAERYVEMREAMHRRKQFEESQRMMQGSITQSQITANQSRRSAKNSQVVVRANNRRRPHQNSSRLNTLRKQQQVPNFRNSEGVLGQVIVTSQRHHQTQSSNIGSSTQNEMVVIASDVGMDHLQLDQAIAMGYQTNNNFRQVGSGGFQNSQEVIVHANMDEISRPRSIDTIDRVQSQHLKSGDQQLVGSIHPEVKCELALCCDKTNIMLSPEMQVQDICYIQQNELNRAKDYLSEQNRTEDIILSYSKQFNFVQINQHQSLPEQTAQMHGLVRDDLRASQTSGNQTPLKEPSKREVAVGNSSQAVYQDARSSLDGKVLSFEALMTNGNIHVAENIPRDELPDAQNIANLSEEIDAKDQIKQKEVIEQATRNDNKVTRYQALTQRILEETYSTLPLPPQRQISTQNSEEQEESVRRSNQSQKEFFEQLGIKGIQVVKRLTDAVLQDYGGGMFSQEYDHALKLTSNNTSVQQPKSDPASQKQIKESEPRQEEANHQIQQANSGSKASDSRLYQLGIRHVKLDQENWLPSPELVPCCVRCFSIATYVLNYQLNDTNQQS